MAKTTLSLGAFLAALCASGLTLLVGVGRYFNAPPGVEPGLSAVVLVVAVGALAAPLVFFRARAAIVAAGLAAVLAFAIIPPENGLLIVLYATSAVLALASYLADGGQTTTTGEGVIH